MVEYNCFYCIYKSNKKDNIEKHLLKKNKCSNKVVNGLKRKDILPGIHYEVIHTKKYDYIFANDRYYCKKCMKVYKSQSGFSLHNKKCKIDNKDEIKNDDKKDNIINENNSTNTFNITNNTINNITNNTINNIIIQPLPYGKEDLSHIKGFDIKRLVDKYDLFEQDIIAGFTKLVHFNDEKPENQNIRILGKSDNLKIYLMVENGRWKEFNKDIIGNRITGDKIDQLYEKSNILEMPKKQKQELETYFDKHSRIHPGIGTDNIDEQIGFLLNEQLRIQNQLSSLIKTKELKTKEI